MTVSEPLSCRLNRLLAMLRRLVVVIVRSRVQNLVKGSITFLRHDRVGGQMWTRGRLAAGQENPNSLPSERKLEELEPGTGVIRQSLRDGNPREDEEEEVRAEGGRRRETRQSWRDVCPREDEGGGVSRLQGGGSKEISTAGPYRA